MRNTSVTQTAELSQQRCLLTAHMGSMSLDCRTRMVIEPTEEVVRFLTSEALESGVPQEEYELQKQNF